MNRQGAYVRHKAELGYRALFVGWYREDGCVGISVVEDVQGDVRVLA